MHWVLVSIILELGWVWFMGYLWFLDGTYLCILLGIVRSKMGVVMGVLLYA